MLKSEIEHFYIHVPFCLRKCGYCSFYSINFSDTDFKKYESAVYEELTIFKKKYSFNPKTIYFGGGTPSLSKISFLSKIINQINYQNRDDVEITLEVNPINVTKEKAERWKLIGINRISMGIQSMIDTELKFLGRLHDSKQVIESFAILRNAGFENISLDQIYALPEQKIADVEYSIDKLISLKPEHISIYCLSLEEGTPLFPFAKTLPNEELSRSMYDRIKEILSKSDFQQYEISNFSKPNFHSRHNSAYWQNKKYLGIGASASGYLEDFRYTNYSDLEKYIEEIQKGIICQNQLKLTTNDLESEYIFLHLRMMKGMNLIDFENKFNFSFAKKYEKEIKYLLQSEMIEVNANSIKLKPEAHFVSNEVFTYFIN